MAKSNAGDNVPVWDEGVSRAPSFPRLTTTIDADVCVIGLGGSGLACIAELLASGMVPERIAGLDADLVGSGAAGRNGGFLLAGTADFYHVAVKKFGRERARRLYQLTLEQIDAMTSEMPAVVRRTGSLRIAASPEEREDCNEHLAALRADGFPVEPYYSRDEGTGLLIPTDSVFDPLYRCRVLASQIADAGVKLFERSRAIEILPGDVRTSDGNVRCDRIVVALDGRLGRALPELAHRVRPVRLQMLATAPTTDICLSRPVYARWGYDYWRQLDDGRLVIGGWRDAGGDEEWTDDATPSEAVQHMLMSFVRESLNVAAPITHRWAATVSYSTNGLPVFGEVRPGVIAAGAYSGTGNVLGAICGRSAARLALGEKPEIAELLAA